MSVQVLLTVGAATEVWGGLPPHPKAGSAAGRVGRLWLCLGWLLLWGANAMGDPEPAGRETRLVEINGVALTEADFTRFCRLNGVTPQRRREERSELLSQWVDRQLVEQHLKKLKITPVTEEVDRVIRHVVEVADRDPELAGQKLAREFGTPEELQREFTFRLAWRKLVETHDEGQGWRRHFDRHRARYDGTRVRARQIFLKVPAGDRTGREQAQARLRAIKERVEAGEIDFGDAAREVSQAPSREMGGDMGWFARTGTVPDELAGPAFDQHVGGLAGPLEGDYGVHLLQVTERETGMLSLEDSRERVLAEYGRLVWDELIPKLRRQARIKPDGFGRSQPTANRSGRSGPPAEAPRALPVPPESRQQPRTPAAGETPAANDGRGGPAGGQGSERIRGRRNAGSTPGAGDVPGGEKKKPAFCSSDWPGV